jgi:hypothetical protein
LLSVCATSRLSRPPASVACYPPRFGDGSAEAKDNATVNAHGTYRVIYHVGDTLNLKTKVLEGRAALTQSALTITGPSPVEVPVRELHGAELLRLHGLGRFIRISHERGTVYVSVVRFVLFGGYFALINFFRTGELARRLHGAIEAGARAFQQATE